MLTFYSIQQGFAAGVQTVYRCDDQGALGESTAMEVPEYPAQYKKRAGDGRVASDGARRAAMAWR